MAVKKSISDEQRELIERVHIEGAKAAYEASLAICRDTKAPAPARATAAATLFRVGGYFDRGRDTGEDNQPHEMTPEELSAKTRAILATRSAIRGDKRGEDEPDVGAGLGEDGIFG